VDDEAVQAAARRARDGDGAAFAELFARYQPELARLCRRMLGPDRREEVEDAVSETFLRARRSLDGFDPSRPVGPWLRQVARNLCVDRLRRRARETRLFHPEEPDEAALRTSGPSPLSSLLWAERREQLVRAVEALPERYRAPLALRYVSELDYAGIAEILGVSPQQVGVLLFRARRRLRQELARREEER